MKRLFRIFLRWKWNIKYQQWDLRYPMGRSVATVYPNGTWHTWDDDGVGGENSRCEFADMRRFEELHFAAKAEAWDSCERQGFI